MVYMSRSAIVKSSLHEHVEVLYCVMLCLFVHLSIIECAKAHIV
jgi:hypothetical protein